MSFLRLLCFYVFFLVGSSAYAEDGIPISKIFDQFVISSAAASKCIEPKENVLNDFLVNFQIVTTYTHQHIAKKYPNFTKEKIADVIKKRNNAITQKVFSHVQEKGCKDPGIKQIVDRFYVQAKWHPIK